MDINDSYKILQGMIHAMATNPDGISTGEIVETYGISRRLVPKYINILEDAGIPIYTERKRYYLDENYFTAFTLTADESEFLYLILERSLILHSGHWNTLRALLNKLGNKMVAPLADYLTSRIDLDAGERPSDHNFKLLAKAKRARREVLVEYHPLNRQQPSIWRIRPFRFTGNLFSDGLYVLCYGSRDDKEFIPLSLKFDRILDVRLTDRVFDIAEVARFSDTFGAVWGVWSSEREPIHVELRFELRHYARLLETVWHPSQRIIVDNDNYVHFSVDISEPEEMVPWIRSWGSGVIVLEPEVLRQRILNSLRRQLRAYGIVQETSPDGASRQHYLWAKYDRVTGNYHVLRYHLLDVAAVAWQMWDRVLSHAQRDWLASALATDHHNARSIIAMLASLHDIGKATPGFQKKAKLLYEMLLSTGVDDERSFDDLHGILSAVILYRLLSENGLGKRGARNMAQVIGGHHGEWVSTSALQQARGASGQQQWHEMQQELFMLLKDVFNVGEITLPDDLAQQNVFAAFLSGFVSVCDWIGSNDTYFPYETTIIETESYFERTLEQAHDALSEAGWFGWRPTGDTYPFDQIFRFAPNPMQQAVIDSRNWADAPPRLIFIEYLTGWGKTEIALYLADLFLNLFEQCGIYVAMPTQATSNQMFERVSDYLTVRYPNQAINAHLIHGQADQHSLYREMQAQPNREGNENGLTAAAWFQNRRRALLAPFAVGTVDQAMLAAMQTRHHFVRQYGLSHKTIIFDEVHAYDTYMNQIVERLLNWLDALHSPVIMLSATLPRTARASLLAQVGATYDPQSDRPYPRLTVVNNDRSVQIYSLPSPQTRRLHIHLLETDNLTAWLAPTYAQGGCIAVICNTVNEAITLAHELRCSPEINPEDVLLFHARTPSAWRHETEESVLRYFGKNGERPHRTILVATQIIEQSLDLDFDLMITSVAPIDLLIQRAGRLHRHAYRNRPNHLAEPVLVIRSPHFDENGVPDFGVDEAIYARYILLKTWELLHGCVELRFPDDVDSLIDTVYSETAAISTGGNAAYSNALASAYADMTLRDTGQTFRGTQYCIRAPHDEFLIGTNSLDLPDDERNIKTRDMRPGIDIICMRDAQSAECLPPLVDRIPTHDEVNRLLQFRITVHNKALLSALEKLPTCPYWQRTPQLRYARPVVFENNLYRIPGSTYMLRLTPFYGLEILQEEV